MQMQHVYQPLMLIELLRSGGSVTEEQVAKVFRNKDPTQLKYFLGKVRGMVGKVLRTNGVTTKDRHIHRLNGFSDLTSDEIETLISLCERRLLDWEGKYGDSAWKQRATDREPVSGSTRYEVLKRAKGRCEACGCSLDERPLDVDHIVPRSLGGENDISNYQALCWLCNTNKGNRDKTDFRNLDSFFATRKGDCIFCSLERGVKERIFDENTLAYAVWDGFPVSEGHSLFIPKRHAREYFDLEQPEINAINDLIKKHKDRLDKRDPSIQGYNIGMNCGEIAGQSVFHCHIHLIPRREGDVKHPKGGVRNIISGKGDYSGNPLKIENL